MHLSHCLTSAIRKSQSSSSSALRTPTCCTRLLHRGIGSNCATSGRHSSRGCTVRSRLPQSGRKQSCRLPNQDTADISAVSPSYIHQKLKSRNYHLPLHESQYSIMTRSSVLPPSFRHIADVGETTEMMAHAVLLIPHCKLRLI